MCFCLYGIILLDSSISIRHLIFTNMFALIRILFAWPTTISFDYDFLGAKGEDTRRKGTSLLFHRRLWSKKDFLRKDWEILLQLQTVRLPTTVTNLTRHAETRARLAPVVISDTSCAHYFSFFCANCCSIRVVRPTKISCNQRFCAHRRSGAIGAGGDFAHGLRSRLLANVTQSAAIMRGTVSSRRPFCFAQERPCGIGWSDICAGETEAICG